MNEPIQPEPTTFPDPDFTRFLLSELQILEGAYAAFQTNFERKRPRSTLNITTAFAGGTEHLELEVLRVASILRQPSEEARARFFKEKAALKAALTTARQNVAYGDAFQELFDASPSTPVAGSEFLGSLYARGESVLTCTKGYANPVLWQRGGLALINKWFMPLPLNGDINLTANKSAVGVLRREAVQSWHYITILLKANDLDRITRSIIDEALIPVAVVVTSLTEITLIFNCGANSEEQWRTAAQGIRQAVQALGYKPHALKYNNLAPIPCSVAMPTLGGGAVVYLARLYQN